MSWTDTEREEFFRSYVRTAAWSSVNDEDSEYEMIDQDPRVSEANHPVDVLSEQARVDMRTDCDDFLTSFEDDIRAAMDVRPGYDLGSAGHDFWLTRNGHGAGFWDRGLGDVGERLTEMSKPYGDSDLFIGDDDLLYVS